MRTAEQVRERDKKMTYEEAKAFLADCNRYKGEISLEPLKKMLAILGNPQDQLKFVHVAGTNGKGSTLAYVSTVLKRSRIPGGTLYFSDNLQLSGTDSGK